MVPQPTGSVQAPQPEAHTELPCCPANQRLKPRWTLPTPARFAIEPDGVIRYAEVDPGYTRQPEPEDMLPAVRAAALVAA